MSTRADTCLGIAKTTVLGKRGFGFVEMIYHQGSSIRDEEVLRWG